MAWEQLSINKPHLVYIILGAFTSLFMLCSSVIKERLYIGEATVATICGIIFGPHAANLIDPGTWGNTDQITLEFSRIVLVVQCFAVGVELPKAYMERHWRSVVFLLVPVMTFGWLITSLFIWAFFQGTLSWLDSLCIAACVTATDPVLASSVVGKGKFAKRVPKHLRDLLSAESGCNDGMAFPFVYLALYIIRYYGEPDKVAEHWFVNTILYECLFGAIYGFLIGYIARRLIRKAHEYDLIDRESFLVYYFVLALFCAGSGSLLGMDDLLIGFACGVGFSNDGWFTHETEESHVSNVIDLLINLAFFVYFGTIIPWAQYNAGVLGLDVWKLVVIALLVLLFRRIPIMLALKPFIPDVKTWREALFAGHFGPIGVGALFVAILARAELETEETTPLADLPPEGFPHLNVIELIWPITTFLVLCSILVHGSSIAVFTLGKHINTLTLTMSYTKGQEEQSWMDRLPRIQSRSKSGMSSVNDSDMDDEKRLTAGDFAPGTFLRRIKADDKGPNSRSSSRAPSRHRSRRSKDGGRTAGGHVSESAIFPASRDPEKQQSDSRSDSETLAAKSNSHSPDKLESQDASPPESQPQSPGEIYEEGDDTVYEDEEGNVLAVENSHEKDQHKREVDEEHEGEKLMRAQTDKHKAEEKAQHGSDGSEDDESPTDKNEDTDKKGGSHWRQGLQRLTSKYMRGDGEKSAPSEPKGNRGPARAYQYGNTIIVEDEDGEVIKKYDIPAPERKQSTADVERSNQRVGRMAKMLGLGGGTSSGNETVEAGAPGPHDDAAKEGDDKKDEKPQRPEPRKMFSSRHQVPQSSNNDDDGLRFTIAAGGRRMSTAEFIDHIQKADPKARVQMVEDSDAPHAVKKEARKDAREQAALQRNNTASGKVPVVPEHPSEEDGQEAQVENDEHGDLKLVDSNNQDVPFHDVSSQLRARGGETAAERRRRAALQKPTEDDSDDDGTDRQPPRRRTGGAISPDIEREESDAFETPAERRRRLDALGKKDTSDSEQETKKSAPSRGIRFAESTRRAPTKLDDQQEGKRSSTLRWGKDRRE